MNRRVQPLMVRDTLGYQYTGNDDTSRIPGFEVEDGVIIERMGKIFKDIPLFMVYFGTPNMFITLWFGFDYGTNPPLGTLII
jgi:hypothetical protein